MRAGFVMSSICSPWGQHRLDADSDEVGARPARLNRSTIESGANGIRSRRCYTAARPVRE